MKHIPLTIIAPLLAALFPAPLKAQDAAEKREMRSAWVATVWRLDWPKTVITSTGNTKQIEAQKAELTTLLDSMAVNNLNAVNFQVRSRADAMYRSSYEPWSADLVETRGLDPGYDPLEFCVEQCHSRGLECHAWINPYRFESVEGQWKGLPGDYAATNPDWVHTVNGASILEPGNPEVTKRICDIIRELVTNYDIDGVLFDDYFYLQGVTTQDAALYQQYKDNGGTLAIGDWRRDNVNKMVEQVYATIKEVKPWVRFGISPAGIACTKNEVANRYGISPCPTGSDWQYDGIYSDPIAWLSQQNLDYISPQIYWTIGNATDYRAACQWWSQVANKWNRHFYSSHSISSLTKSSKAPTLSTPETGIVGASGPNNTTFAEYADEVRLNRQFTQNEAPGSIFYSAKYLYSVAPLFSHYLKTTVFNTHALVPSMPWFPMQSPGIVKGVTFSGSTVAWQPLENMRYTVYAVPQDMPVQNFNRQAEHLLGVCYGTSMRVPQQYITGYKFAVCPLDRYGNEYSASFAGQPVGQLPEATPTFPLSGQTAEVPFIFRWQPAAGATHYRVQVATDPQMKNLIATAEAEASELSTSALGQLPLEAQLYWTVTSCGINAREATTAPIGFTCKNMLITAPENGAETSLTPTITWANPERLVTVQVSADPDFAENTLAVNVQCKGGSYTVEKYRLASARTYYARVLYVREGIDMATPTITFQTIETTPEVPIVMHPQNGGVLYADQCIKIQPTEGLRAFRVEVCAATSFSARQSYLATRPIEEGWNDVKTGSQITINSKALADGKTYYVRVRGEHYTSTGTASTAYSPTVQFTYYEAQSGIDNITTDACPDAPVLYFDLQGRPLIEPLPGQITIRRQGHNVTKTTN